MHALMAAMNVAKASNLGIRTPEPRMFGLINAATNMASTESQRTWIRRIWVIWVSELIKMPGPPKKKPRNRGLKLRGVRVQGTLGADYRQIALPEEVTKRRTPERTRRQVVARRLVTSRAYLRWRESPRPKLPKLGQTSTGAPLPRGAPTPTGQFRTRNPCQPVTIRKISSTDCAPD